jgi:transcription initiation factor TFIIB
LNLDGQETVNEFDLLENVIGLSNVTIDKAKSVVREANRRKLIRRRTASTLVTSAVYNPCRETNIPQTLHDIAAVLNVKRKRLGKCSRMLMNSLDLKVPTIDPFEYMMRLADMINVSEKVKRLAIYIE